MPAPLVGATSEPAVAVTVIYWTEVEVTVDVKMEQESSEPAGGPSGGDPPEPPDIPPEPPVIPPDEPSVGAAAIAVGTLDTLSGLDESRGIGLTVTVKTPVAVGKTVASTDDGDSIGEPPKSVPLCVPFVMG
jgi:hypothetical protein